MSSDLIATEPNCPNCGTRCVSGLAGIPYCRGCKAAIIEHAPEA
ncbi:hypothetical protein ACFWWU_36600 [Streptomyces sp. NPDC058650]